MTLDRKLEAKRLSLVTGYSEELCERAVDKLGEPKAEELLMLADKHGVPAYQVAMALSYE